MGKLYEISEEQLKTLLDACRPVLLIATHCGPIPTPQENANDAWSRLGTELEFDHMTVKPSDKGQRFFYAEPSDE